MADTKQPLVQPQAYYPDGTPIPPEAFGKAAAEGQARFEQGQKVVVRNEAGELKRIDATDIHHPGYTILHPDEVSAIAEHREYGKGFANQGKAALAGAARGLTLGGSDYLAAQVGGEGTRRSLDALRRQNPITSGVAEVAGAAAPVLLSGGAAAPEEAAALAAGEGAEALGAGAEVASSATRGIGSAASSAIKTAGVAPRLAAGAGSLAEKAVGKGLEAVGYEGKTVLSRAAAGAAKFGAQGATEGAIYGGAQAADDAVLKGDPITAEKIVAGMGDGALFGGGLGAGLGALGPLVGGLASKVLPDKEGLEQFARDKALKAVGRDTENYGKDLSPEARAVKKNAIADDLTYRLKTGEQAGAPVLAAGDNAEAILNKLSQAKQEAGSSIGSINEHVNDLMVARPELAPSMDELFQRVKDQVLDPLNNAKSAGSRAQARAVERELSVLREEHESRVLAMMDNVPADTVTPSFLDIDKYRQTLNGNLNPKGTPFAMRGVGNPHVEALEKTSRVINDFLKEKASAALTAAGEDPSIYREANRQYGSFLALEKAAQKTVSQNARNRSMSASDHGLGVAAFLGSLVTGGVGALGGMITGGAASVANKLLRERGNSMLSVMARRAADMDGHIDMVAKSLAGHADAVKAATISTALTGKNLKQKYDETAARVRELSRPEVATKHVSSMIPEVTAQYPGVGASVSAQLLSIYQHLGQTLPTSSVSAGDTLTPKAIKDRVDPVSMRQFMSRYRGATNPRSVFADLQKGQIDRDALNSAKQVYPQMFQQLRAKTADYVAERTDELPYRQKVFLSMAFDFEGDSSVSPQRLVSLQNVITASPSNGKAQSGAPKPRTARPRPSKLGKTFDVPADDAFGGT